MARTKPPAATFFDVHEFLASGGVARRVVRFARGAVVFAQGARADSVYYIQSGGLKLSVLSSAGKEAVVALLGPGDFAGEGCLAGQPRRMGAATAVVPTSAMRIPKTEMIRVLHEHAEFSDRFIVHMLARNIRIEEDLVDQLFNSSEKRLPVRCCCSRGTAGTPARRTRCRKSRRSCWPRWWAPRARA